MRISRRLTLRSPLQIWGVSIFTPFSGISTFSGISVWLMVSIAQRFLLPYFSPRSVVHYSIDRKAFRKRRASGFAAIAAAVSVLFLAPLIEYTEVASIAFRLATGIVFAILLAVADRALSGPVRLTQISRRTGRQLRGYAPAFEVEVRRQVVSDST